MNNTPQQSSTHPVGTGHQPGVRHDILADASFGDFDPFPAPAASFSAFQSCLGVTTDAHNVSWRNWRLRIISARIMFFWFERGKSKGSLYKGRTREGCMSKCCMSKAASHDSKRCFSYLSCAMACGMCSTAHRKVASTSVLLRSTPTYILLVLPWCTWKPKKSGWQNVLQQRLYMIYMFCIVACCFVVLGVEAFVGSISLPVHRFSTATGDSTTTRTRCWQFYFSRSRPGIHASKTIIEYHRSIAVLEASGTRCFKGCGPSSLWSSRDSWELWPRVWLVISNIASIDSRFEGAKGHRCCDTIWSRKRLSILLCIVMINLCSPILKHSSPPQMVNTVIYVIVSFLSQSLLINKHLKKQKLNR